MLDFIKMQGSGNDYIFLDLLHTHADSVITDAPRLARTLSQRRFSVGSDGIVLVLPSGVADAAMRIFNADGSEGAVCGNALLCLGRLLYESNHTRRSRIRIETRSGVREVLLCIRDGEVERVSVDMGRACVGGMFITEACGEKYEMTSVELGNRHAVTFCPDTDACDAERIAEAASRGAEGTDGVNVELCELIGGDRIRARVIERGSGETFSCGSGACACAAAAVARGYVSADRTIGVVMRGGELKVRLSPDGNATLTGGAVRVFDGRIEV